jgi:hypothetical protein
VQEGSVAVLQSRNYCTKPGPDGVNYSLKELIQELESGQTKVRNDARHDLSIITDKLDSKLSIITDKLDSKWSIITDKLDSKLETLTKATNDKLDQNQRWNATLLGLCFTAFMVIMKFVIDLSTAKH